MTIYQLTHKTIDDHLEKIVVAKHLDLYIKKLNDINIINELSVEDSSDNFIISIDKRKGDGTNLNLI